MHACIQNERERERERERECVCVAVRYILYVVCILVSNMENDCCFQHNAPRIYL